MVLGLPWLWRHNLHIDWVTGAILAPSPTCHFLDDFVFLYLDDILIFFQSLEQHVTDVQTVLNQLFQYSLYIKPEKCQFPTDSTSFLGFVVGRGNLQMDFTKVSAVRDRPVP